MANNPLAPAAKIETGAATYEIVTGGHSYSVAGFSIRDGRGNVRTVRGCRDARAAFADAKHLAKLANARKPGAFPAPASWRLIWL